MSSIDRCYYLIERESAARERWGGDAVLVEIELDNLGEGEMGVTSAVGEKGDVRHADVYAPCFHGGAVA